MPSPECDCGPDCPGRTDSSLCLCGCSPVEGEEPKSEDTAAETVLTTPDQDQPTGSEQSPKPVVGTNATFAGDILD